MSTQGEDLLAAIPATPITQQQAILLNAYHEGGHAVVAAHNGLAVTSLDLEICAAESAPWSVGGITYVSYLPDLAYEFSLQGAAGELAAFRWLHEQGLHSEEFVAAANADHDRDAVIELLAQDGIRVCWPEVRRHAQKQVDFLWPEISSVARAAAETGRLTGHEIDALLSGTKAQR